MLVSLCFIPYILIVLLLLSYSRPDGRTYSLRESVIVGALIWFSIALLTAEILSLWNGLRFPVLVGFWSLVCLMGGFWLFIRRAKLNKHAIKLHLSGDWLIIAFISAILLLIGLSGLMAVLSPPNNPDSLSYHMSRQIYWLQQGSLDHFHTSNDRQIMMPPLSEIIGLHLMILSQGDFWASLPQWLSYLLATIAASLVALELGASLRGQAFSALLVATLPIAFLQASNNKNDLMLGMLTLILAWQVLRFTNKNYFGLSAWILVGCNLGLIWMVKGTGLIYSLPLMLFFGGRVLYRMKSKAWQPVILISISAMLLCAGHYTRNFSWYGTPLGTTQRPGYDLVVENIDYKSLTSNILRNLSLHLTAPKSSWNEALYKNVDSIHNWIGIDINDPRTTYWADKLKYYINYAPHSELSAPATIHVIAGLLLPLFLLIQRSPKSSLRWFLYVICISTFLLFCMIVKWQPWHARLHVPIFMLIAPLTAAILSEVKHSDLIVLTTACLCFMLIIPALHSSSRPILASENIFNLSRLDLEYRTFPHWKKSQMLIYELIHKLKPQCVKFDFEWAWQYPIQKRLLFTDNYTPHFWGQVSKIDSHIPDMIVCYEEDPCEKKLEKGKLSEYSISATHFHPFRVLVKKSLINKYLTAK